MTDDRPAETSTDEAFASFRQEVADKFDTVLARLPATGTIEPTFLPAPKYKALFMDGTTKLRSDYPDLWNWINDNALSAATPGGTAGKPFGWGDNSTTFVLPDMRGRILIGAGTQGTDVLTVGVLFGSARLALTTAQMPSHDHNVTVNNHSTHNHALTGGTVPGGGDHGGHFDGTAVNVGSGAGTIFGLAAWNSPGSTRGNHGHGSVGVFADQASVSAHVVNESLMGGTTAVDRFQPSIPVNFMIWT